MISEVLLEKHSGKNSTKSNILDLLGKKQPLNAKQIHLELKNSYANDATYQAIHKTLKQLQEEKVVSQTNNKYVIELQWLSNSKKILNDMENQTQNKRTWVEELESKNTTHLEFEKLIDVGKFVLLDFIDLPNPEEKPFISLNYHIWPSLVLSSEMFERFKAYNEKYGHYVLTNKDTLIDRLNARTYTEQGAKVKFHVERPFTPDTIVHGDYVAYVYLDPKGKKIYNQFCDTVKSLKNLNIAELFNTLFETSFKNIIHITKNKEIANHIRETTINEFGEKK